MAGKQTEQRNSFRKVQARIVMFRIPGFQNCLVNSFALEQNYVGGGRFNTEAATSGMAHPLRVQLGK